MQKPPEFASLQERTTLLEYWYQTEEVNQPLVNKNSSNSNNNKGN